MTKPFFDRLKSYFADVGKVLRGQSEVGSIFPNPTDAGLSRERVYAEFLRLHLPSICNVYFGGFLFDHDGGESRQIDVIITNDRAIRFNLDNPDGQGRTFACVDGCVAVASLKSNLSSNELKDALLNFASIPQKQPIEGRVNPLFNVGTYDDWPFKIVYASRGVKLETALKVLKEFYGTYAGIPMNKRPNLIHVAGSYFIVRGWEGARTRDGTQIPENSYHGAADLTDVFGLCWAVVNVQQVAAASANIFYRYHGILDKIPF